MRTTIDLSDDWRDVADLLGTTGKSETVNRALGLVLEQRRRAQAVDTFRSVRLELDQDTMRGAWE